MFTFFGTQVRIAEIERPQSLFKMSMNMMIPKISMVNLIDIHLFQNITIWTLNCKEAFKPN